jgi:hypothetical protein
MTWRREGALALIYSDVDIVPIDRDEARLEPLSWVARILRVDGERLCYHRCGVG